ncbi:cytochrome p450 domain-containing protein [Ditylenchus destructor]|uniref:Cytochrome p450 domain-containing protein n=1 Tax=Ditylenchus destructor TaxID=166010 RepID=A0AAD4R033_9BILA|nr:cytochrome p450 domain-containing protein [Ditylenchus destructor]
MHDMFKAFLNPLLLLSLTHPKFISKIPFIGGAVLQLKHCNDELYKFFNGQIEEHRKSIDFETDSTPTDFVEAYLREAHKKDKEVCEMNHMLFKETTNTTLAWGLAYMISHPEVQEKLHQELDRVVGSTDRLVTITDRLNLHYTNAVVAEVQRIANILPQNLPRKTTREVTINGVTIGKDVIVLPQIGNVLFDEKLFPKPLEFNPSRFIDENGCFKKCDELIPFSMGKRQCLGEPLARMELFLFIANIFNSFKMTDEKQLTIKALLSYKAVNGKWGTFSYDVANHSFILSFQRGGTILVPLRDILPLKKREMVNGNTMVIEVKSGNLMKGEMIKSGIPNGYRMSQPSTSAYTTLPPQSPKKYKGPEQSLGDTNRRATVAGPPPGSFRHEAATMLNQIYRTKIKDMNGHVLPPQAGIRTMPDSERSRREREQISDVLLDEPERKAAKLNGQKYEKVTLRKPINGIVDLNDGQPKTPSPSQSSPSKFSYKCSDGEIIGFYFKLCNMDQIILD